MGSSRRQNWGGGWARGQDWGEGAQDAAPRGQVHLHTHTRMEEGSRMPTQSSLLVMQASCRRLRVALLTSKPQVFFAPDGYQFAV